MLTEKLLQNGTAEERIMVGMQISERHHKLLKKVSKITQKKMYEIIELMIEQHVAELEKLVETNS